MKFSTQVLLMIGATLFLMKGGIGFLAAAWKMVLPMLLMSGAWFMVRKAMTPANLKGGPHDPNQRFGDPYRGNEGADASRNNAVIEICPHCLSEVGSCPKCKKKKFF
ncbi:MAG: hypothetical protein H7249_15180 [Chitinophagaceae bacterium]|nr:hypothetical protein [Oligoflexus sp.]